MVNILPRESECCNGKVNLGIIQITPRIGTPAPTTPAPIETTTHLTRRAGAQILAFPSKFLIHPEKLKGKPPLFQAFFETLEENRTLYVAQKGTGNITREDTVYVLKESEDPEIERIRRYELTVGELCDILEFGDDLTPGQGFLSTQYATLSGLKMV